MKTEKKKNKERATDSPYYEESALKADFIFCTSIKYGGYIKLTLKKMQKRSDYIAHNSITLGKPLHLLGIPGILEETNIFSGNTEFLKHL